MKVYYPNGEKKDIIHFYNDIYIKQMKEYIIAMKPGEPLSNATNITTPGINAHNIMTP